MIGKSPRARGDAFWENDEGHCFCELSTRDEAVEVNLARVGSAHCRLAYPIDTTVHHNNEEEYYDGNDNAPLAVSKRNSLFRFVAGAHFVLNLSRSFAFFIPL